MHRRAFIGSLLPAFWPRILRAQQRTLPVVGFLNGSSAEGYAPMVAAFRSGLRDQGFIEGESVAITFRWAEGHYDRLQSLADDLIARNVAVIIANTPANLIVARSTSSIPIVFTTSSDPVAVGLVPNLNAPGGNVTGISQLNVEVGPKRLELANELKPGALIGLLVNASNPQSKAVLDAAAHVAADRNLDLRILTAADDAGLEEVFARFRQTGGILVVGTDAFFNGRTRQLAALAARYAVPTIYQYEEFTSSGGLLSYGGSVTDSYRLAGSYAAEILRGKSPGRLPVQQSTRVELIVNLQAARALGIEVPASLAGRADKIIE